MPKTLATPLPLPARPGESKDPLRSEQICAWRGTLPEGLGFEATQALRQVLSRAVACELIDVNPAKRGVSNPLPRFPEKRPFESWAEIAAIADRLGPVGGAMITFAAATGLRPAELVALEERDADHLGGVVYVRRQIVRWQVRPTKTPRSMRPVPLQSVALEALERLPESESPLLFPSPRGRLLRPPLQTPRPRRTRARRRAPRRLCQRDRRVDAWWTPQRAQETRSGKGTRGSNRSLVLGPVDVSWTSLLRNVV
jgi:integrase